MGWGGGAYTNREMNREKEGERGCATYTDTSVANHVNIYIEK